MKAYRFLIVVVLCILTTKAFAADEHKPRHGGVLVEVKEIQYELVAKPDMIVLYVEDHGKLIDTKGATAKLTLLSGKEKSEVMLVPAGGNKLEAKGSFAVAAGTKAVAIVTLAGKPPATVRFAVK